MDRAQDREGRVSHPDFFNGLMDWPVHGPRDHRIADRVLELADLGERLADIEDLMLRALNERLATLSAANTL